MTGIVRIGIGGRFIQYFAVGSKKTSLICSFFGMNTSATRCPLVVLLFTTGTSLLTSAFQQAVAEHKVK